MIENLRPLAVVNDYAGLHCALRARLAELNVSHATVENVSGLQDGYVGKLLSPTMIKSLGRVSMGPLLQSLGLVLVVAEDRERIAQIRHRLIQRIRGHTCASMPTRKRHKGRAFFKGNSKWGRRQARRKWAKMTNRQRSQIGRRMARLRWAKR